MYSSAETTTAALVQHVIHMMSVDGLLIQPAALSGALTMICCYRTVMCVYAM